MITCYVLLLISLTVFAQSGKERFSGRVIDTETNQPVPFATVRLLALPDSTLLGGGATDAIGKFQLSVSIPNHAIKAKSLLLQVSYVGYKQVFHPISISSKSSSYELGDINLTQESYALDEAVVVGQAPMAVTEGDTTVFNASAYRTPEGSMLEELVKQLPGGEIDADGKLLIHGKEVKKILVDGKEFLKGGYQGKDMDNTSDKYVLPWIEAVKEIAPRQVMIYTIDRETPDHDLQKATHEELNHIVTLLEKEGISATASY